MRDDAKTREQLIGELISLREEIARMKDLDIAARRLDCSERLAIGLSHNFNNILTPILGYSQLGVKASPADANVPKYFREISNAAEKAAELTNMLLAFSGRQIRYPRLINLNAFITNMEALIKGIVGEKVQVTMTLASDLGPVKVDPKQIERILRNLVANSCDAMPNGGRLTIETSGVYLEDDDSGRFPRALAGEHIMMVVSDTGCGMTEDTSQHALEPFFTTYEPWEKMGMGLSVCYGIVSQNGGRIDMRSAPEEGTVVKVFLPQAEQSLAYAPADEDDSLTASSDVQTILIVERDLAIADLASRALREHGYRVITASNASDAIANHGKAVVDVVVASIVRPAADRYEIQEHLGGNFAGGKIVHVSDGAPSQIPMRFDPILLLSKVREAFG